MGSSSEATLLLRIKRVGEEALSKTSEGLEALKDVALATYAAMAAAVGIAIKAWRDQEKATNALNGSLVNQGIYSAALSKEYQEMASALQKVTTYGDEAIVSAQAQLQTYLGQTKITKDLTKSVLDFATAQGIDLDTAAKLVGKTVGTNTNALARYGIEIDANASKSEKLAAVVGALNSKFGGQAEAAAKGLGSLEQMKNAVGDIFEVLGERLAPTIAKVAKSITSFAEDLQQNQGALDAFVATLEATFQIGAAVKLVFFSLGSIIGQVLGGAIGGVVQMLEGNWKQAWETFKTIPANSLEVTKENYKQFQQDIAAIDDAFVIATDERRKQDEALAKASADRKVAIQREASRLQLDDFNQTKQQELITQAEHELMKNDIILRSQLERINAELANENDKVKRLELLREKEKALDDAANRAKMVGADQYTKFRIMLATQEAQAVTNSLNQVATLQNAKTKELAVIGKAAAISMATINTALAITQALAHIPPPWGFVAAGLVGAAGAAQVATIAGVQLAEGGIVRATPGGVPALIGEGGRDEAVIPLDDPSTRDRLGLGGGVTVHFNGPVMGDQSQAREFAIALDRELMKLRRDGESLSFDSRLT